MEELKEFRSKTQSDTQEKKYIDKERVLAPRPDSMFKDSRQPKYNRYTPLVSNKARILEEALNANLMQSLKGLQLPQTRTPLSVVGIIRIMGTRRRIILPLRIKSKSLYRHDT